MISNVVGALSFTGWDLVLALLVIVVSWVTSRYVRKAIERVLIRVKVPEDVHTLGGRFCAYLTLFLGFGIALGFLGVSIQPVLAVVILVAVAAVLVLRGIADNLAAGIVIQSRQSLRLGDLIESLGFSGHVHEFTSRSVVIECTDGRTVHLPNRQVLDEPLVNYSSNGQSASEAQVRVEGAAAPTLISALQERLTHTPGVRTDPPPRILVTSVEPHRTIMTAKFWHRPDDGPAVTSHVVLALGDQLAASSAPATVTAPPPEAPLVPPPDI